MPRICAFFHDKDDSIRHFAAETLGANGNEAVICLVCGVDGVELRKLVPKQVVLMGSTIRTNRYMGKSGP